MMALFFVGRERETAILKELMASENAQLVAILGRRRVGKTYLVRQQCAANMVFECSGAIDGTKAMQLANFSQRLTEHFGLPSAGTPVTWQEAFLMLEQCLKTLPENRKKVIFFDEFPWLDNHRSSFLSAFSYWWNMYGSRRGNLVTIICGSATSWMIQRVVNNKGGLHNRITQRIHLEPFTLAETEAYLHALRVKLPRYQVAQLYMVLGGIPHYLTAARPGMSTEQIIQDACFSTHGLLKKEFENLYAALFSNPEMHIQLVKLFASKQSGLTRSQLLATGKKLSSGGGLTKALDELVECGFVMRMPPFNKKLKDTVYRLADEFTLFYFRFMYGEKRMSGSWEQRLPTQVFEQWAGYAFENLCLRHTHVILQELGISGIANNINSWRSTAKNDTPGAQVDLLIDRSDNCINLCEIKFVQAPFVITKKYAEDLHRREQLFRLHTGTRKALFTTLIAPYGTVENEQSVQGVARVITLDALFDRARK